MTNHKCGYFKRCVSLHLQVRPGLLLPVLTSLPLLEYSFMVEASLLLSLLVAALDFSYSPIRPFSSAFLSPTYSVASYGNVGLAVFDAVHQKPATESAKCTSWQNGSPLSLSSGWDTLNIVC